MTSQLSISIGQYSDKGFKPENQDFYGVIIPQEPLISNKGIVSAIADGVSSSTEGKLAAESCVKGFLSDYLSTPETWTVKTSAHKVLTALNSWLYSKGRTGEESTPGMVTTFSALIFKSTKAHIFHIGDSRIYRLQENNLECLTHDHRIWLDKDKNYLSRAMGIDIHLDIDYRNLSAEAGDLFVMTTDGVHDFISDKQLTEILLDNVSDINKAARLIVETALKHKSSDNVTCQIIRLDSIPVISVTDAYKELTKLPFPPDLSAGMILDGYKIIDEIHASKRTQVYKAIDQESKKEVIIKTPSVNYEDDAVYIDNFVREEWIGKRVNNKHILKIEPQKQKRQFLYYVTEYVNGQTLRQWITAHSQPDIREVREIAKQIAAGLRVFHRFEMLHQDLKPENIMLDQNGMIKIIDFGSTKIAGIAEITTPLERVSLLGTKNYTAPEYLLGQPGSNRSDLFSLGVITYEMLTGKLPFGDKFDHADDQRKISNLHYYPSYHYNPMIPIWLDKALEKATNPDPNLRYDLLSEFVHDICSPNDRFMSDNPAPLIERNPIAFWKGLSVLLVIANMILLYFLLSK